MKNKIAGKNIFLKVINKYTIYFLFAIHYYATFQRNLFTLVIAAHAIKSRLTCAYTYIGQHLPFSCEKCVSLKSTGSTRKHVLSKAFQCNRTKLCNEWADTYLTVFWISNYLAYLSKIIQYRNPIYTNKHNLNNNVAR